MPPKPDPMLASPYTEPTADFGNTSAGKLSIFARHPVYPSIATDTNAIDIHASGASTAGIADVISTAKKVTDVLRAIVTVHPRFKRRPDIQPPRMLPKPATIKGIQP